MRQGERFTVDGEGLEPANQEAGEYKAAVHVHRFVVFQIHGEWVVVYEDRRRISYTTRSEAEAAAFTAAGAAIAPGHTASVLVWLL
jgi:hypothetical protein